MNKFDIARALDDISSYLELSENNRFRALAFERAAHSIRALDAEPADLIASERVDAVAPGDTLRLELAEELMTSTDAGEEP